MYNALILLLIADCLALVVVVLLQSGKGGGLAAGFGGSGTGFEMMGSRQTATFLHSSTRWLGGAFLVLSLVLSFMTVRGGRPRSLIDSQPTQQQQPAAAPDAAAPGAPTDLQSVLEGTGGGAGAVETGAADDGAEAPPAAE